MNIIFVRHGESKRNAKIVNSDKNSGLTEKGKKQTEALGKRLKKYKISVIYTSNLLRAKETGKIISKILGIPVKESLQELDEYPSKYLRSKLKSLFNRKLNKRMKKLKRFLDTI